VHGGQGPDNCDQAERVSRTDADVYGRGGRRGSGEGPGEAMAPNGHGAVGLSAEASALVKGKGQGWLRKSLGDNLVTAVDLQKGLKPNAERLNSPRSKEACLVAGVRASDLAPIKRMDEFMAMAGGDEEMAELAYTEYNKQYVIMVNRVVAAREKLIAKEGTDKAVGKGLAAFGGLLATQRAKGKAQLDELQRERLEKEAALREEAERKALEIAQEEAQELAFQQRLREEESRLHEVQVAQAKREAEARRNRDRRDADQRYIRAKFEADEVIRLRELDLQLAAKESAREERERRWAEEREAEKNRKAWEKRRRTEARIRRAREAEEARALQLKLEAQRRLERDEERMHRSVAARERQRMKRAFRKELEERRRSEQVAAVERATAFRNEQIMENISLESVKQNMRRQSMEELATKAHENAMQARLLKTKLRETRDQALLLGGTGYGKKLLADTFKLPAIAPRASVLSPGA